MLHKCRPCEQYFNWPSAENAWWCQIELVYMLICNLVINVMIMYPNIHRLDKLCMWKAWFYRFSWLWFWIRPPIDLMQNFSWYKYWIQIWWCRLEKSLSSVDIKVETQELEKFSTINRFAKFHIRAQPSSAASSGTSTFHKMLPQRFVVGRPVPEILPEGVDCLSL